MEPACLRFTELPHTSKLFVDFLYNHNKIEGFYKTSRSRLYPEERRPELIKALRMQNKESAALELLSRSGTAAVVTGQQVGLFSGPAYTIYKALTAARIAEDLTARGTPAVPIFWLATEDHDFAEVNHSWIFNETNTPVQLKLSEVTSTGEPVGTILIPQWPIAQLRGTLKGLPFGEEITALVEETHRPGATLGEAFRGLLQRLLAPFDFLFIDPMHPATRQLAAPILQDAVAAAPELNKLLLERNRELEAAGYHAQVHVDARTSLAFVIQDGKRLPLRETRFSESELRSRSHDLSPNALLRPVVQDYMLPTVAYVGGPAEVAYFAQSQVLYERLLGRMPRVVPRNGYTLFDARTVKLMERYGLHIKDLFNGEADFRERMAAKLTPPSLQYQFDQATEAIAKLLEELSGSVQAFDPTLGIALDRSRAKVMHQLSKSRAKVARETMRRDERATSEAAYLYNGLFPNKHLQERLYSILPFMARHGLDLVERMYDHTRLECPDHVLLPL